MKKHLKIILCLIIVILFFIGYLIFNLKKNVNKVYPSVVHVECKNEKTTSTASGLVYEEKNGKQYILTSYHVIKGYININIYDEELNYEKAYIVNYDEKSDIAILAINSNLNTKKANFDLSKKIKTGEEVYILTSILYKNSYIIKDGIIKIKDKKINLNGNKIDVIGINYNIEEGDSGSPLIDKKGKVIGMIFLKDKKTKRLGYAQPINLVLKKVKILETNKNKINLGAVMTSSTNIELLEEYKLNINSEKGVVILFTKENYPLNNAGIQKGDVITKFNNKIIENISDLKEEVSKLNINETISIEYIRDGKIKEASIKLDK